MSLAELGAMLWPQWLREWIRFELLPRLGLLPHQFALGTLRGMADTLVLLGIGLGAVVGSRAYMAGQYDLPPASQQQVLRWAPVADYAARRADVPREVPLVLWYKENSLLAVNPDSCTGIIGAYDLVRSGELPCFAPGPITDVEVARQLTLAATEFKKRCPDIRYTSQDPALIQRCYYAYNAGVGAAERGDPTESAYVMNGYDAAHQNMIYSDVELGTVRVTALGAWPVHLAVQSLIVTQWDVDERPAAMPFLDTSTRVYDWVLARLFHFQEWAYGQTTVEGVVMSRPGNRPADQMTCLEPPPIYSRPGLRPDLNPVSEDPILTQDVHGCDYNLPGLDISSSNRAAILLAPMAGQVTTYTDQYFNSTIRIENDEWIVWLLHPRSYYVAEGDVARGERVGVMGAVGYATGPHVHYSVFSKVRDAFVDPAALLP